MYYAITATAKIPTLDLHGRRWERVLQYPMFFLREDIQGIQDEAHAEKIARHILGEGDPDILPLGAVLYVTATKVD